LRGPPRFIRDLLQKSRLGIVRGRHIQVLSAAVPS